MTTKGKKVVLVTGCSSGFGFLTAIEFARHGAEVYAGVRNLESEGSLKLPRVAQREDLNLKVLPLDVRHDQSVTAALTRIKGESQGLDVLINNAGFGYLGPVEELDLSEVRDQYETNVFGVLRMIKATVPMMRERQAGLIINVSSIAGRVTFPLFGVYSSSKFALESLSEALRFELKTFGIKIVLVEPGTFVTKFDENRRLPQKVVDRQTVYEPLLERFLKRREHRRGRGFFAWLTRNNRPEKVAELLYRISLEKNPKLKYLVGGDAYFYHYLHRILPFRIWEWLLHRVYQW